jgi:acetyltransferase-like isoleucine patch superfamily enzyme
MTATWRNVPSLPGAVPYTRDALATVAAQLGWKIGEYSYGVPVVRWWGEPARLIIGKFCSIADNVSLFLGGNHRIDWATTYPFSQIDRWPEAHNIPGHPATRGDIVIGHDVWLASACTILSGVTVGNGAVIGAHAVVSRDVEPYAIVTGNPGVTVRKRFEDNQVAMLEEMQWWHWPEERIRSSIDVLMSPDVPRLYAAWKEASKSRL